MAVAALYSSLMLRIGQLLFIDPELATADTDLRRLTSLDDRRWLILEPLAREYDCPPIREISTDQFTTVGALCQLVGSLIVAQLAYRIPDGISI